ncbi:MAG: hypothetical protein R3292_08745 [Alcanivorax sp.]|nr:hypothetical protein [Alcanivorax sp.]
MTAVNGAWLLLALLAGTVQVGLLARAARQPLLLIGFLPRLLLVTAVLGSAAWAGHLPAAAAGWLCGFAVAGLWLWWRWG